MNLKNCSDDELKNELQKREDKKYFDDIPNPLDNIDYSAVKKLCEEQLCSLADGSYREGSDHYIYEAAIECVYGKNIWDYINKKL